jgi:hypothetical protein
MLGANILRLALNERPHFVCLELLAGKIDQCSPLVVQADRADLRQELKDRHLRHADLSGSRAHRRPFTEGSQDLDSALTGQAVHVLAQLMKLNKYA